MRVSNEPVVERPAPIHRGGRSPVAESDEGGRVPQTGNFPLGNGHFEIRAVGGGTGGGILAARMASGGRRVVMVEKRMSGGAGRLLFPGAIATRTAQASGSQSRLPK